MVSIYDLIKFDLKNLNLATELLESCDWDESVMKEKIATLEDVLSVLPVDQIKDQGFDRWVDETLVPVLELNGLSNNQAQIVSKVIFSSREELTQFMNLGEV